MKKRVYLFAAAFLLWLPFVAQGQGSGNAGEPANEHRREVQENAQLDQDMLEQKDMVMLRERLAEAWSLGDMPSVQAINGDILQSIQREIRQLETKQERGQTTARKKLLNRQQEIYAALSTDQPAQTMLELVDEFVSLMEKDIELSTPDKK